MSSKLHLVEMMQSWKCFPHELVDFFLPIYMYVMLNFVVILRSQCPHLVDISIAFLTECYDMSQTQQNL